jgi:NAD+ synthase (glutamine-hydrolysing)
MQHLRLALAQMNATVGDLAGNTQRILQFVDDAQKKQVDLIAFPELAITGYPPEDLLFRGQFLADADKCLKEIIGTAEHIALVVGTPHLENNHLYNAAVMANKGDILGIYHKNFLPNYGVFDEVRYFAESGDAPIFSLNGALIGINICEDIWYSHGPAETQKAAGANLIININASPYHRGKGDLRQQILTSRAREHKFCLAYVNMVGGQDELVFDGQSMVFNCDGDLLARGPQFEESLIIVDINPDTGHSNSPPSSRNNSSSPVSRIFPLNRTSRFDLDDPDKESICTPLDPLSEIYAALVTGTRDYVVKSGFAGVVIGLSGGIDSALTAAIATDALGPSQVHTIFMPSQYTSTQSAQDAERLASNLEIEMITIPITNTFQAYINDLGTLFAGRATDTTEENIQARIRGNFLMAASNKFGWLVLTTGNKSEMATGYCTLYGDMAGGFAVIKDVPKTLVQDLAKHRNRIVGKEIIPSAIIQRPPTAELRPNQTDEDSLPPYAVLDPILEAYVEADLAVEEMQASGMPSDAIALAVRLVDRSEYKRRQAPPGIKITPRSFGRDRRLPIVNKYNPIQ